MSAFYLLPSVNDLRRLRGVRHHRPNRVFLQPSPGRHAENRHGLVHDQQRRGALPVHCDSGSGGPGHEDWVLAGLGAFNFVDYVVVAR